MALKDLSSATMTIISRDWLDPNKERPLLLSLTRVAPLVVDLDDAHLDLLDFQEPALKVSAEMAALTERVVALDARHDRMVRGIFGLLSSLAELTEHSREAPRLLTLRDELFPQGKSITKRSYIDEAGEAARSEARLSFDSKALLRSLTVGSVSLGKLVDEWRATAIELGEVEKERILLAKDPKGTTMLSVGKARIAWIRAVNAILAMLDREKALSEADRRRILEPLETALAKVAAKKKAAASIAAESDSVPVPELPPAPTPCPTDSAS